MAVMSWHVSERGKGECCMEVIGCVDSRSSIPAKTSALISRELLVLFTVDVCVTLLCFWDRKAQMGISR